MDRNYNMDNFEQYLRQRTEEYKMYPSDAAWNKIQQQLKPVLRKHIVAGILLFLYSSVLIAWLSSSNDEMPTVNKAKSNSVFVNSITSNYTSELSKYINVKEKFYNKNNTQPKNKSLKPILTDNISKAESNESEALLSNIDIENTESVSSQNKIQFLEGINLKKTNAIFDASLDDKLKIPTLSSLKEKTKEFVQIAQPKYATAAKTSKFEWVLYFTPSVSYRILFNDNPYLKNNTFISTSDLNSAVHQYPSIGMEIGTGVSYSVSNVFRLRAGLQLNYNRYNIKAFKTIPEIAPLYLENAFAPATQINSVSNIRNFSGYTPETIANENFQVALPIGAELTLLGNKKFNFNIGGSIQPTYTINNNSKIITNDYKNYVEDERIQRRWNLNSSFEAFFRYQSGSIKMQIGPQFRYQVLSSYKANYPIKEHLVEYGIKVGIIKTLF